MQDRGDDRYFGVPGESFLHVGCGGVSLHRYNRRGCLAATVGDRVDAAAAVIVIVVVGSSVCLPHLPLSFSWAT